MNIYSFLASQVVIEKEIFKIQRVGVYQYPSSNEVRIIAKTPEESKKIYDTLLEIIKGNPSRIIIGLENNRIAAINPSAVLIAGSSEERIFTNSCSLSRFDPYDLVYLRYPKQPLIKVLCKKAELISIN